MKHILLSDQKTFQKAVDEIINSPKYIHLKPTENILDQILEKIIEMLDKIFDHGYKPSTISSTGAQNGFMVVVVTALIVLLFYFLKSKEAKVRQKKVLYGETIDGDTTYEGLYQKALACEKEKNYRDAVRLHFVSMLFYMNEKSLCFLDDAKTNDEIVWMLKQKGFKAVNIFKNIGDYFQYIWYGDKEIQDKRFLWYKEKIKELFTEVHRYHEKK
ncbi:hypothetical protein QBE52_06320 [Clostridiaceae bacterium 35-E11]